MEEIKLQIINCKLHAFYCLFFNRQSIFSYTFIFQIIIYKSIDKNILRCCAWIRWRNKSDFFTRKLCCFIYYEVLATIGKTVSISTGKSKHTICSLGFAFEVDWWITSFLTIIPRSNTNFVLSEYFHDWIFRWAIKCKFYS
jgi:hypothetical protein